jgi:hypothetical protein
MSKNILLLLVLASLVALAGCLSFEEDGEFIDTETYEAALAASPEVICQTPTEPIDGRDAEPIDDATCTALGYCCNDDTGNVSKTSKSGCNDSWYATRVECVEQSTCGSACNIN